MNAKNKAALTDRALKALKPARATKRYFVWDAQQPNLGVRVTDKGHRSFVVVRRKPGASQPVYHVLGAYPVLSLADARKAVPGVLGALAQGKDPKEVEEERRREDARRRQDTFVIVAEEFIRRHVARLRGAKETEALIRRELLGEHRVNGEWVAAGGTSWRARPITDITRRDVIERLEQIVDRGTPYQARKVLAVVRKLFNWALQRDIYGLDLSPCARINSADLLGAPESRTRVLTDDELGLVWRAADQNGYPFGTLVQVLLLTGQRLREISDARWSEVDTESAMLTIPAERMKAKIGHTVPLTPKAIALLGTVPRFERSKAEPDNGVFVFTTTSGKRPVSGFSKAKARLDKEIARLLDEARTSANDVKDVPPWTIHDLRRTVRTRLSSLAVLPLVAELVIGHKQTGIHAVYDLHRYDAEKRDALQRWEDYLLSLVEPPTASEAPATNVVALHRG